MTLIEWKHMVFLGWDTECGIGMLFGGIGVIVVAAEVRWRVWGKV